MNAKRGISDEENERHKRVLALLMKQEGNKQCADCKTRNPTWASVNLGVFVCLTCSGIHRSLGVHISQVRSCNLDTWLPRQVEFMRVMGNLKGNRYWEAQLPDHFKRPPGGEPNPELAAFIRSKYADRRYAAADAQPPNIDNWQAHPYAGAAAAAEPTAPAPAAAPPATAPAPAAAPAPRSPALAPALRPPAGSAAFRPQQPAFALAQQQQQQQQGVQAPAPAPRQPQVDLLGVEVAPSPNASAASSSGGVPPARAAAAAPAAATAAADPFDDWHDFACAVAPAVGASGSTASAGDPFANLGAHDLIGGLSMASTAAAPPPATAPAPAPPPVAGHGGFGGGGGSSGGGGLAGALPAVAVRPATKSAEDILKLFDRPQQQHRHHHSLSFGAAPHSPVMSAGYPRSQSMGAASLQQQGGLQHHQQQQQQQQPLQIQYGAPGVGGAGLFGGAGAGLQAPPPMGAYGHMGGMGVAMGPQHAQHAQQQLQQQQAGAAFLMPSGL